MIDKKVTHETDDEDEREKKLMKLYEGFVKLERAKRAKKIKSFLRILAVGALAFALYQFVDYFFPREITSYMPHNTAIGLPSSVLMIISTILLLVGFIVFYLEYRNFITLFLVSILSIGIARGTNPLMHFCYEIKQKEYNEVNSILKLHPELTTILPSYVNTACEMTNSNYKIFTKLAENTHATDFFDELPIKKSVNEVKKMCANTVFKM